MGLSYLDYSIVGLYAVVLVAIAWWVSREKPGHQKDTSDYFLASKSLPWWAIGASLIAANISAEQVIGMSGEGFRIGLAISSYEWMAAITLIIVGKYFLPIFLEKRIYTMPQFLEQRYNGAVRSVMAVFWLGVFTLVNLTSIMWLGSQTINTLTGFDLFYGLVALAAFTALYSLYGGLKAVALTDIIQVVMLIAGGLLIAYLSLDALSPDGGPIAGFMRLLSEAPEKFDMILAEDHPHHSSLPGLSVLVGGMWIMNLSYWGFNQYIIQRALGAKNVAEAQKGILFAAFLKMLMPLLIVVPGMAAYMLVQDGVFAIEATDRTYPTLLGMAPDGIRGLIFAALIAAIVSSLGSMMNSIATIFTMDIYKPLAPKTSETALVMIGRIVAFSALVLAVFVAKPLLGSAESAFQWLQEFTGFFTPGVVTLFFLGMFWKRATALGAFCAAIGSLAFSLVFKFDPLSWGLDQVPFMNRVGFVFLLCMATMILVSLAQGARVQDKAIHHEDISFKTGPIFNLGAAIVAAMLIAIYTYWF